MSVSFQVEGVRIGSGNLFLIAGPCVIESEKHAIFMAEVIKGVTRALNVRSFSRRLTIRPTALRCAVFADLGWRRALRILKKVKDEVHIPVLTDVHDAHDVGKVSEVADVLQIPAFLCRQTDLIIAAAMSERAVNIKKGQFVSPWDMKHAVEKCRTAGNDRIFLTERGSSFGYNNLVVDMRSLAIMRKFAPVVFDATHSVQLPSASHGDEDAAATSGGQPEFIPVLARAAVAAGVDGVFLEVHDNPKEAKSDGANALESTQLRGVLKELLAVHGALQSARSTP